MRHFTPDRTHLASCEYIARSRRHSDRETENKHPRLNIILGHLGEGLPYSIWRVDHRIKKSPHGIPAKKPLGDYFRANFHITTAGNFRTQTLIDAHNIYGDARSLLDELHRFCPQR